MYLLWIHTCGQHPQTAALAAWFATHNCVCITFQRSPLYSLYKFVPPLYTTYLFWDSFCLPYITVPPVFVFLLDCGLVHVRSHLLPLSQAHKLLDLWFSCYMGSVCAVTSVCTSYILRLPVLITVHCLVCLPALDNFAILYHVSCLTTSTPFCRLIILNLLPCPTYLPPSLPL